MPYIKLIFSVIILSLGISGAVYITKNPDLPSQNAENGNGSPMAFSEKNNNVTQESIFVEQLAPQNLTSFSLNKKRGDLANELSQSLAQSFVEKNPDGPVDVNGQKIINTPDLEEVINNLPSETLEQFNIALKPVIRESDLNITGLNTEASLDNYVESIQKIISGADNRAADINQQRLAAINDLYQENGEEVFNNFLANIQDIKNIKTNDLFKNLLALSIDYFSKIIILQQETLDKLYKMPVPESVLGFHKNLLALILAKQDVLTSMQNLSTDPLMAMKAQRVLEIINTEIIDLTQNQLLNLKINS